MAKTTQAFGVTVTALCLGFTGASTAWADGAHAKWVEDPYQDHDTTGTEVRLGSLVGIMAVDGAEYTGLGGAVAAGHRWGRIAIDAEYSYLELTARGPSNTRYGDAHDLGVNIRLDVIRLGSHAVGPNSMVAIYVEAGAGRTFRRGDAREADEPVRRLLPTGSMNHLAAGFGVMFDHRLEQPRGFPNRVGWQLGWRVIGTPRPAPETIVTCRGSDCAASAMPGSPMEFGVSETPLVLGSSLAFTW
jgi:hypothetical protein